MITITPSTGKWTETEIHQMRRIQQGYYQSLDLHLGTIAGDEQDTAQPPINKEDAEFFLPPDSALRSERGELLRPRVRGNVLVGPFDSSEHFAQSLTMGYWLQLHFNDDRMEGPLVQCAKEICNEICTEQSKKELRDRGQTLKGLTADREVYTPLSLVLHEIKLWSAHFLFSASPQAQNTYMEIMRRIKFLNSLHVKDMWLASRLLVKQGMSGDKLNKLFGLLERLVQFLTKALDVAYKEYAHYMLHNKLGWLLHVTRQAIFNTVRVLAGLSSLDTDSVMAAAREGRQIQPTDLIEKNINPMSKCDWSNFAHVVMRGLCVRQPVFRAALSSDFTVPGLDTAEALSKVSNPAFYKKIDKLPNLDGGGETCEVATEPKFIPDRSYPLLPLFYSTAIDLVGRDLRTVSRAGVKYPVSVSSQSYRWTKAFGPKDAVTAVQSVVKALAAIEDLVPAIVAANEVWTLASSVQNVKVLEVLRPQAVRVVGELQCRLAILHGTESNLLHVWTLLGANYLSRLGKMTEAAQLLLNGPGVTRVPGKAVMKPPTTSWFSNLILGDPTWLKNLDVIADDFPSNDTLFLQASREAKELAREISDYPFTVDMIHHGAREKRCCNVVDALCDKIKSYDYKGGVFNLKRIVKSSGLDWLNLGDDVMRQFEAASIPPNGDSESRSFVMKREALLNEMATLVKGQGILDTETAADVLNGIEDVVEVSNTKAVGKKISDKKSTIEEGGRLDKKSLAGVKASSSVDKKSMAPTSSSVSKSSGGSGGGAGGGGGGTGMMSALARFGASAMASASNTNGRERRMSVDSEVSTTSSTKRKSFFASIAKPFGASNS